MLALVTSAEYLTGLHASAVKRRRNQVNWWRTAGIIHTDCERWVLLGAPTFCFSTSSGHTHELTERI